MSKITGAIDIGGSGFRAALVELGDDSRHRAGQVHRLANVQSHRELAQRFRDAVGDVDTLGISSAGFVDADQGVVRLCRAHPWVQGQLKQRIADELRCDVRVMNDGEAHLCGHLNLAKHPMLCLSIGTSVAFGCTDDNGNVRRPRSDSNWDIGALRLRTRASNPELWSALGSEGLSELEHEDPDEAIERFGWRLGAALFEFAITFQPESIVLAGGIIDQHWHQMEEAIREEFVSSWPDYYTLPVIFASPFGAASGLVGAAAAATYLR